MITDIFLNRYTELSLAEVSNAYFVQLFNLYDDHHIGIHGALLDKIQDYPYSSFADEHIRIISQSQDKLCSELGYKDLDKPEYIDPDWGYRNYRIFKNYVFDTCICPLEKLSFFEILYRDTETHLLKEIDFLETAIPKYKTSAIEIKERCDVEGVKYHNTGQEKLKDARPQLEAKKIALKLLNTEINQRLKQHNISLTYHNGYFQKSTDSVIEQHIEAPFWDLISNSKYKNVELDMLQSIDIYDSGGRDSAFYAAKALESLIKIICDEKGFTTGDEKGAASYLSHLNSKENGAMIINDEKEELLSLFRIRNTHGGHGPGNSEMLSLTNVQTLRYINSVMVWICSLSKR